jgi:hypothetical protein
MQAVTMIGLHIAKSVFHVHGRTSFRGDLRDEIDDVAYASGGEPRPANARAQDLGAPSRTGVAYFELDDCPFVCCLAALFA